MKLALKEILLNNTDIKTAIEKIENLYADKSDIERVTYWRQKYYVVKSTNDKMSEKIRVANDKLIRMMKILMEKP